MNSFGAGILVGKAAATTTNPNPTPRQFGHLQEVSFDDTYDEKKLFGPYSAPLRGFRGQRKVELKAKFGYIDPDMFAELFHGVVIAAAGATLTSINEAHTIPASTPWQVTIAPPSSGTFAADWGVRYALTGASLKLVASGPTQGQYSVNTSTGVYTFATADASAAVLITYDYTVSTGKTISSANNFQQEAPYFSVRLSNPQDGIGGGAGFSRTFFKCSSNKLSEAFKQQDIVIPEMDIAVFDPGTGVLYADHYATN